ncbi:glycosyltransferase family 2 protein [Chryseobacterium jejuense]|uniref:Glycosyltransferase, GT2 family n=2 Tax=Chryseobacterium jejuense TaxID=445960 RepID=A0A2X2X5A8_CHRJE|nr:glycosyltransferase family 2 protein [Chryseobacterium jejuense]SDI57269.1 Glycosyltransferase, GT2 family [Chryseobacterium jejuense]SQB47077.1 dTDP-Rha:alpha-D-GlcNAc-pyrophosphate polyprenol, alpha-3-L-rhamnosyltransferase [Chryseobacterium jejuense]
MANMYIIIVTYNAMKWAERCFTSLRKSNIPVQTIVVDNGSTDGTQDYIKINFPEVDFIQSPENLGFGKANNIGIEKAYKQGADFFYLMNQDAWIFPNSIEQLLEVYHHYPNKEQIGILSPMHLDGSEKKLDLHFENYLGKYAKTNRLISDLFLKQQSKWYEIDFVNAAHWLLPKSTIEIVGGFNPFYFHYGEDYDYLNRVLYNKKKVILCPDSLVVHDTKQHKTFQSPEAAYKEKWLSLRLQKQTQFMNPAFDFDPIKIKKQLLWDFYKFALKGYTKERIEQREMNQYFLPRLQEIHEHRQQIINSPHPFLNL